VKRVACSTRDRVARRPSLDRCARQHSPDGARHHAHAQRVGCAQRARRATHVGDVDFVVDLGGFQVPRFVAAFSPDFYVDEVVVREAVSARDFFNLVHEESGWKVDVIVAKEDSYRQLELARRVQARIGDGIVPVVSREDLILAKLWWSKDTGSELQRRDVANLIASATTLDRPYLERWAKHLGVESQLVEVLFP
jgi:hypothetical protein